MEILAGLIAAAGVAAVPAAVAAWLVERWRFGRRNADGRCAVCARPWDESPSDDRFLIHGRLTCERCAAGTRARIGWQLGLLVAFALFGSGMIVFKEGLQWTALIPPLSAGAMTVAAAALMKLQNRRAQRELALGTCPAQLPPLDPRMLDEARTP